MKCIQRYFNNFNFSKRQIKHNSIQYNKEYWLLYKGFNKNYPYNVIMLQDNAYIAYSKIYGIYYNGKCIKDIESINNIIQQFNNISLIYGSF